MTRLIDGDLAGLFGIEMEQPAEDHTADVSALMCGKCKGRGKFIGWSGRTVGNCFTCDGTGLARSAGVALSADDCTKCAGSGEWRSGRPCFACSGSGKVQPGADITVDAIETAFTAASGNGIKRPKLRLDTFIFSRAPDTGRNAGAIYVKQHGEYLGKVSAGKFHGVFACDGETKARIITVAADPHNAAKAYGMKTGSCSCCGRELTNGISVELGIGPVCRDKFGW